MRPWRVREDVAQSRDVQVATLFGAPRAESVGAAGGFEQHVTLEPKWLRTFSA